MKIFKWRNKNAKKRKERPVVNASALIARGENPMHIIPLILANRKRDAG